MGMMYNVVIGNPPYRAPNGWKPPPSYKCVDTKYGSKRLYQHFVKLAIDSLLPDGTCVFVIPQLWLVNSNGLQLRQWFKQNAIIISHQDISEERPFPGILTSAAIFVMKRGTDSTFHGLWLVRATEEWQRRWLDLSADPKNLMRAGRGGVVDIGDGDDEYYFTYKRGIIKKKGKIARHSCNILKAEKLIIFPEFVGTEKLIILPGFLAPNRNNFQKAEMVDTKPFSDIFVGIVVTEEEAPRVLKWIRSPTFLRTMRWLATGHCDFSCKFFLKEDVWNEV